MEFSEVLARRRMVRNYADEPVDVEVLEEVARAAFRAPSAGNSQGLGVVLITDPDIRKEVARIAEEDEYVAMGFDPWISRAPGHIVISVSEEVYHRRYQEPDKLGPDGEIEWPVPYWWVDAGAAMMAVLLAAVDKGLAAGFLGVHSVPDLSALVGLPADQKPIGIITVGRPAPDRRSRSLDRRPARENVIVHRDRWQG
ncbi:MAG: nitroreductase family protein [Actinomycetes bacterium]|jgi:nitroreductase|nr:MAG: nitroreductase [Actinomycetota bacterium]